MLIHELGMLYHYTSQHTFVSPDIFPLSKHELEELFRVLVTCK